MGTLCRFEGLLTLVLLVFCLGCSSGKEAASSGTATAAGSIAGQRVSDVSQEWECRNDLEVVCNDGDCSAETGEAFTPMSVTFNFDGTMSVCAYSGCWEGVGKVTEDGEFLVLLGQDLPFSTASDSDSSRQDIGILFDRTDRVAVIKGGQFAHPLWCRPAD